MVVAGVPVRCRYTMLCSGCWCWYCQLYDKDPPLAEVGRPAAMIILILNECSLAVIRLGVIMRLDSVQDVILLDT